MPPSTSAATSEDEFQDAADGDSQLVAYALADADGDGDAAAVGGDSTSGTPEPTSTNGATRQQEQHDPHQTDTLLGGGAGFDGAEQQQQEEGESAAAEAATPSKSKLKKMKKKQSKAALRLAASRDPSPSPPSRAESPAPTSTANRRNIPSPPPLLPPGARLGPAFANAQPFSSSSSTTSAVRAEDDQEQQGEEGPNGDPPSPRGTSTLPLPCPPLPAEQEDQLSSLPPASTTTTTTTQSRPFSLLSNPDSPPSAPPSSTPTPKPPPPAWQHQSLTSHSHADPNQTAGGGQTSPSLTGMARRSELGLGGGGAGGGAGGERRGGALQGRELEVELGRRRMSGLVLDGNGNGNGAPPLAGEEGEEEEEEEEFQDESLLSPSASPSPSFDEEQEEARDDASTPTRSNGLSRNGGGGGKGGHRRGVSDASSLGGGAGAGGGEGGEGTEGKYGFLRQRVEQQERILHSNPSLKRASLQATSEIRQSFARVREEEERKRRLEVGQGEGEIDWDFWGRVMSNYEEMASTNPRELSRAIQRGIPPALRGMTWQLMAATKDPLLVETYSQLLKQTSPHEKSIGRDLNRTFPKHEYFRDTEGVGQENLFNVVKAYSIYDEEVGYTQGLQFIVGPLLLNMPDEEAFCVLVRLMKSYDLRSHYTPNMPGLQLRLFQFDRLLEELLPGVFMHLLRQGIKSSMYASQWFLTLFGYRFPLELVSSVFDLVFAEGVEAIFRFSVAILKRSEDKIVQLEFEDLIEFLKNELFEVYAPDPDDPSPNPQYKAQEFVREALQVKITPLMLDQFGEEWTSLCAQQSAHTLELDSLRKANAQLSSQVRQLEASLSQVNEEHCELVKQVVMAKLEREELEDELVKYKIAYADLSHQQASDGASSSRASIQAAQEREDRLSRGSTTSLWSSAMSRSSGSTGV